MGMVDRGLGWIRPLPFIAYFKIVAPGDSPPLFVEERFFFFFSKKGSLFGDFVIDILVMLLTWRHTVTVLGDIV